MVVLLLAFAEPKYFVGILGGGLSADNRSLLRLCIYPGRAVSSGRGCSARPRNDDRRSLGPRRVCRNSYGSLKGTIRIEPHDICWHVDQAGSHHYVPNLSIGSRPLCDDWRAGAGVGARPENVALSASVIIVPTHRP